MNDQLRKIAIETDAWCDKYYFGDKFYDIEWEKKFAELIVRECVDKITTYDLVPGHSAKWEDIYDIHARLLQDLGEELKDHFGFGVKNERTN